METSVESGTQIGPVTPKSGLMLVMACLAAGLLASAGPALADLIPIDAKSKPDVANWTSRPTQILARLDGFTPRGPRGLGRYGGLADSKNGATGFFRVQKVRDRWWLIDPDGLLYQSKGIASVVPGAGARATTALGRSFGSQARWADSTASLFRSWGFNSAGAWSAGSALSRSAQPMAYAPIWNFMSAYGAKRGGLTQQPGHAGYPNNAIFVFDPAFADFCETHARQLDAGKNDPWLLGHFSDNELPWPVDALQQYLDLPASEPGHLAAQAWLNARKGRTATAADILPADAEAFQGYQADRYFSIVSKAIRKHDPNHLYLGSRFHGHTLADSIVVAAAGPYLDAIGFNWYGSWTPDAGRMASWERWSGKPFLITEWYAKGADAVGLANTSGAGWLVRTQKDRGNYYQNFALGLLRSKACLGWHWFKYQDNDPEEGGDPSNQDSNKGVVDIFYRPYPELVAAMQALNGESYSLAEFFDGHGWTGLRALAGRGASWSPVFRGPGPGSALPVFPLGEGAVTDPLGRSLPAYAPGH
jgi:hypothetical protein